MFFVYLQRTQKSTYRTDALGQVASNIYNGARRGYAGEADMDSDLAELCEHCLWCSPRLSKFFRIDPEYLGGSRIQGSSCESQRHTNSLPWSWLVSFSIPRPNVIQSDQGYSVEVLGRVGLRYMEGSQDFHIDSEVLAGPAGLIVYSESIKVEGAPSSQMPFVPAERTRIIENIRAAFRFRGLEIEIV